MSLLLLLATTALAYESTPAELLFTDSFDVFEALEYDTGKLPADSPVSLRFYIKSKGGSYAEIEAQSDVSWPEALVHGIQGFPGGGWFALVTDIEVKLDLIIDMGSMYTGSVNLWKSGLYLDAETTFDGLLLKASPVETVELLSNGKGIDTLNFPISVVTGLSINVSLDVFPRAWGVLSGTRIETVTADEQLSILDEEGALRFLTVPPADPSQIDATSSYFADLEASLDIVLHPAVSVCVFGSCWSIAAFDIPIGLGGFDGERPFVPEDYAHPLPSISVPLTSHDFGDVLVGNLTNLSVPIQNAGKLPLEGWARIEGSERISVFPEYFYATAGNTDGVMLTFAPDAALDLSAKLVLESNDPLRPILEIPLLGEGFVPEVDPDVDPDRNSVRVTSCGCAASPAAGGGFGLASLIGLLALRRRR